MMNRTKQITLYSILGVISYILVVLIVGIEITALPLIYGKIRDHLPIEFKTDFTAVIKNTLYFFIIRCFVVNGYNLFVVGVSVGAAFGQAFSILFVFALFSPFIQSWIYTFCVFRVKG